MLNLLSRKKIDEKVIFFRMFEFHLTVLPYTERPLLKVSFVVDTHYSFLHVFLGVVLPGNTVSIPFSFKSVDAGIFSERWLLETQPVLLAGQEMEIALKGIATKEDLYDTKRKEIEVRLF